MMLHDDAYYLQTVAKNFPHSFKCYGMDKNTIESVCDRLTEKFGEYVRPCDGNPRNMLWTHMGLSSAEDRSCFVFFFKNEEDAMVARLLV